MESKLDLRTDLPRKYVANIAAMYGIKPGRMGKKRLRKAILRKMKRMEEQSLREAIKPTPELIKRLGSPLENEGGALKDDNLKPCPFCGGKATYKMGMMGFATYCDKCGAEVLFRPKGDFVCGETDNASVWNKREPDDELQAHKDAIQAVCDKFATIDECNECPVREYGVCPSEEGE